MHEGLGLTQLEVPLEDGEYTLELSDITAEISVRVYDLW